MNRTLLLLATLAAGHFASAQAQTAVPPDMQRLQTAYEAARERATRPIDEKYLAELVKLQATYTKAAKLDEALAVANEIKGMKERMGLSEKSKGAASSTSGAAVSTKPAAAAGGQETVTIAANTPNGYRIGAVKKGDVITLEYVSGKWKSKGGISSENPDDPNASYKDDDRVVIAEPAGADGSPGKMIVLVPPGTTLKPFTYLVQTSRPEVVLRINNNSDRKENPGSVVYKLSVSH
ncbi:hypothetical protein [Prosthecobacter sp.]|uniref:hypothetical protein n=1 Tax=Prosthecobacter sp. TaxID=1965333 RepID=UPI003784068B